MCWLEYIAHCPEVDQSKVNWLFDFVDPIHNIRGFKAHSQIKQFHYLFYSLRETIVMAKYKSTTKKKTTKQHPHWANLDVRPKEVRKHVQEWLGDFQKTHEALLHLGAIGGSISLRAEEDGSILGFIFIPCELPDTDTLAIRSSGIDMATCLGVLMFKFTVMLPDYELPIEAEEELDFS